MTTPPRLLIVEDDPMIRSSVQAALVDTGFLVRSLPDGDGLEDTLAAYRPAVVILDWMLPGRDGPRLVQVVRSSSAAGIVLMTARDSLPDRVRGLEIGADDYLVKPFALEELVARIRALLRRLGVTTAPIHVDDLVIDEEGGSASRDGHPLALTATEFRVLAYLATNRGRVVTSTQILSQVWGYDDYADNLVQVHLSALRRKMEEHGPRLVHTVRGLGYVLRGAAR
jgi:two-component system OmpR family response regulator